MSQKNKVVNFVIHDTNGQPQMVKVVQNSPKPVAQIKIKPSPVKVYSAPQNPVYKTVKIAGIKGVPKVVRLPIETLSQIEKTAAEIKTEPDSNFYSEVSIVQSAAEVQPGSSSSVYAKSYISPAMSHASRKRHDSVEPVLEYTTKRRKHADKVGKGLRHFSMKVCEKVRTKGFTSYNEVADELVAEFTAGVHGAADSQQYDQKNIRRRVYDALNVLMAMNIISKEKKEIRWLGLPTNSIQECTTLEKEKESKLENIERKTQSLEDLVIQHVSFKNLIERNKDTEAKGIKPSSSSAIHLPFIVVNTNDKALIDCSISNDKTEYMFKFNKRFQIKDDIDILKMMGLHFDLDKGNCSEKNIESAKAMVPDSLRDFVEQMGSRSTSTKLSDMLERGEYMLEEEDVGADGEGEEEEEAEDEGVDGEGEDGEADEEGDEEEEEGGDCSGGDSSDVDV